MAFMALWRGYGAWIGLCIAISLRRGMASSHNLIVSSTRFSCESAPSLLSQQHVTASSGYFSVDFLQVVSVIK
ncbi:hypothetical protein DM860_014514 [Cuscuta australis]|uniref:Uncharacterized protein n=1 Tax=Cuscuta australis TaxID=267555 RepID=A0A328DXY9_9ASTE|nr:hypothetical protein DM860_014514 [Cuscuta australis]